LPQDYMKMPFILADKTHDDRLSFDWKSDEATKAPLYTGTGPVFSYESFALYDETQVQEAKEQQRPRYALGAGTGPNISCRFFGLRNETKYQEDEGIVDLLRIAADSGDEDSFVRAMQFVDWSGCSTKGFVDAVYLALKAGAHLAARNLATEGAQRYPQSPSLQKMSRLLSPPRVLRTNLPPVPYLGANKEWMQNHAVEYRGRWVALREGKLVASAPTARELKAQVKAFEGILVTRVV
jgi:hypothetical protein